MLDEFERALLRVNPDIGAERAGRQRTRMEEAFPEALVTGYERLTALCAHGPDPEDAHVMAAAKQCDAAVIVTANLEHFPSALLGPVGL